MLFIVIFHAVNPMLFDKMDRQLLSYTECLLIEHCVYNNSDERRRLVHLGLPIARRTTNFLKQYASSTALVLPPMKRSRTVRGSGASIGGRIKARSSTCTTVVFDSFGP